MTKKEAAKKGHTKAPYAACEEKEEQGGMLYDRAHKFPQMLIQLVLQRIASKYPQTARAEPIARLRFSPSPDRPLGGD
jgi:hypothetical protein